MKLVDLLQARWRAASKREQRWLLAAALGAQLQQMQSLQAQAKALQGQPRIAPDEARRQLEASLNLLGTGARLTVTGERVTLTLKGASPDALAQWLAQVRLTAHVVPSEARLTRGAAAAGAAVGAAPTWDGTLVLTLSAG